MDLFLKQLELKHLKSLKSASTSLPKDIDLPNLAVQVIKRSLNTDKGFLMRMAKREKERNGIKVLVIQRREERKQLQRVPSYVNEGQSGEGEIGYRIGRKDCQRGDHS